MRSPVFRRERSKLLLRLIRILAPAIGIIGCFLMSNDVKADTATVPLSASEFRSIASKCAPSVSVSTLSALVRTESSYHPYAIAVVGGASYYPDTLVEAKEVIKQLEATNKSYSVGLGQVNKANFSRYDVNAVSLLDPCLNLKVSSAILSKCYESAAVKFSSQSDALSAALSCYYSGNYETGKKEGYVSRVVSNSKMIVPSISILTEGDHDDDGRENASLIVKLEESLSPKPVI